MRDILFRGKRTDNGEWVYGDLIQLFGGQKYIIDNKFGACIDDKGNFINTEAPFVCEVIPETVGQYTGLKDKNGKKIFEGDVVKIPLYEGCQEKAIAVVAWDILCAVFYLHGKRVNTDFYRYFGNDCEVIGNIHDNPESIREEV